MTGTLWTVEQDARLKELWPDQSAREIGALMGKTRNSVIGRANRLALPMKKAKPGRPRVARVPRPPRPPRVMMTHRPTKRIEPAIIPEPMPVNGGLHIMELEHRHCREVIGYGAPDKLARYCGVDKKEGSSFCEYHHRRNFQPPKIASSSVH